MENNPKKSRALLITIIILIIFIIFAFLLYKNRDLFGVKTSTTIAKIFSPLIPSVNQTSKIILAQAGEDINQGDQVSLSGTSSDGNPLVMKAKDGDSIYGYANQAILNGNIGSITLTPTSPNNFLNSFANFLNNLFGGASGTDPPTTETCTNGATNYPLCTLLSTGECNNGATNPPLCTTIDGECLNGANNPPVCSTLPTGECLNGATNPPLCTILPGGGCANGATNPPLCTTIDDNKVCLNGATNPPLCTILPGGGCANGATNPPLCTIDDDKVCSNGATNFPLCTIFDDQNLPDLTAGPVRPTNALLNTRTTLFAEINNIGEGSTRTNFASFFAITNTNPNIQINPNNNPNVTKSIFRKIKDKIISRIPKTIANDEVEISVVVPVLYPKASRTIQTSYVFPTTGIYYIRACADKTSSGDDGVIDESNENNNCGPWTTLTVTSSLPPPGTLPECSDGLDNDGDGLIDAVDPNCHIDGDLNKLYVPLHDDESSSPGIPFTKYQCNDGLDNDGDGLIDNLDPGCHLDGDLNKTYVATHNDEANPPATPEIPIPVEVNICRDIEQNPPMFTDEEKARLDVLLRKFYLISSNLRTTDDIVTIYSEIEQYRDFISEIDGLTKQCYLQTNSLNDFNDFCNRNSGLCFAGDFDNYANKDYKSAESGGWSSVVKRRGNPWFSKSNTGSFPYSNTTGGYIDYNHFDGGQSAEGCKIISGYYYGAGTLDSGQTFDCSVHNNFPGYGNCSTAVSQRTGNFFFSGTNPPVPVPPIQSILDRGCKWKEGVYFDSVERLINIW
jgi:hypothetical protein